MILPGNSSQRSLGKTPHKTAAQAQASQQAAAGTVPAESARTTDTLREGPITEPVQN